MDLVKGGSWHAETVIRCNLMVLIADQRRNPLFRPTNRSRAFFDLSQVEKKKKVTSLVESSF